MKRFFSSFFAFMAVIAVFFGVLSTGARAEAYVNSVPFSAMKGTWAMTNGSGTMRVSSGTGSMNLISGTVWISSLSANSGDTGGNATIKLDSKWRLTGSGGSTTSPLTFNTKGTFTNTGDNAYTNTYSSGSMSGKVTVTMTSATNASVTQTETSTSSTDGYTVTLSFSLTKTSDDPHSGDSSGGGGCDAGAGAGILGLALLGLCLRRKARA